MQIFVESLLPVRRGKGMFGSINLENFIMIYANNTSELTEKLKEIAIPRLTQMVNSAGFSTDELEILDIKALREKIDEINKITSDHERAERLGKVVFTSGRDYILPLDVETDVVAYGFTSTMILFDRKKEIIELIKRKSQAQQITTLGDLINNVQDHELKQKLEIELTLLKEQSLKFNEEQDLVTAEERGIEVVKRQLENKKIQVDILEKKSQIWLNILARESIASIIGALLLIVISCCLIIAMFMKLETTKIVESAFLLILGYFFGQAVSKK